MRSFVLLMGILLTQSLSGGEGYTLEKYLDNVRAKHQGFLASKALFETSKIRSEEATLLLSPSLFANYSKLSDAKPTMNPAFQGTKTVADSYSLGVSKLTSFGMAAKLSYNVNYVFLDGVNTLFVPLNSVFEARPLLEISQSLWKNGFGSETRSQLQAASAAESATGFGESFKARMILFEAEMAYWRLALAKEVVKVNQESVQRSKKIESWVMSRVKQDLSDKADLYQAQAGVQLRELELQSARDEQEAATRSFFQMINEAPKADEVPELLLPDVKILENISPPPREKYRDDVKAAEAFLSASRAQSDLNREKVRPQLDLVGSAAFNGRSNNANSAMNDSLKSDTPTFAVGVKFMMPLDFSLAADVRSNALAAERAAEMIFTQRVSDQEKEWADLSRKLEDAKKKWKLAQSLERLSEQKLHFEKERHKRGRSTTYQVLLFEQDFANSQLGTIRVEAEIISLHTRMKTFGGTL